MAGRTLPCRPAPVNLYVQQNQPPGVPPLELTGERTLPDVPAENYWYRRHLAVYEWIAARVAGGRRARHGVRRGLRLRGAGALGRLGRRRRRQPRGARARPAAVHAARICRSSGARSRRSASRRSFDAVVFLQTIEHVDRSAGRARALPPDPRPGGVAYVSTPNVLTLAPPGRGEVRQPVAPAGVPGERVRGAVPRRVRRRRDARAVPRPQAPRSTSRAAARLGPRSTSGSGSRDAFYDRFTPAIATSDFALRPERLDRALDFLAVCRTADARAGSCKRTR